MASRTVKSPAGETIQITGDDDWIEATGAGPHALRQWQGLKGGKALVIRALWEHGEFTHPSGRVSSEVVKYMNDNYPGGYQGGQSNIMSLWQNPVNYPAVIANTSGKRTYALKLTALPEIWHRKLMEDIGPGKPAPNGDRATGEAQWLGPQPESVKVPVETTADTFTDADWADLQLDAPTVYEEPPPLELHVASQVAMSLLTTVVEIISAGNADTTALSGSRRLQEEFQQAQHLLSQRLMENDKLRRQLREAGDAITALRQERDGLRTRLRMTEHNLTEVLKGETAQVVNSEIRKRVDQIMRTTPSPKGE